MTDQELTGHFHQIGEQFEAINKQFEAVNRQFEAMNRRFDGIDRQFGEVNARLERVETTVRHIDVEVHRQGIMAYERHGELRLATETFHTLQRVTNAKIDGVHEAIDPA